MKTVLADKLSDKPTARQNGGRPFCPNADSRLSQNLERAKGIEPSYAAWEAAVLPLNYARNVNSLVHFSVRSRWLSTAWHSNFGQAE